MKTSNIILFSLIGSIPLLIIAGALELRLTGSIAGTEHTSERKSAEVPITDFKYLVIDETTNLQLTEGTQSVLTVWVGKNDPEAVVGHHQTGDTLYIDHLRFGTEGETLSATLSVNPSTLKTIRATRSNFSIRDLSINNLKIQLYDSHLNVDASKAIMFGNLSLEATDDSNFSFSDIKVDTLTVRLNESRVYSNSSINKVKGVLQNNSSLVTEDANDIEIRKDKTSRIH